MRLNSPGSHSDFIVPSTEIPTFVPVVTSSIASPTKEEFLLPLLKLCKNAEKKLVSGANGSGKKNFFSFCQ